MFYKITAVTPLAGEQLLITFANGCVKRYDMAPLLDTMPVFRPLRQMPGLMQQVRAEPGGIYWTDELDLDAGELWKNGVEVCPLSRL